MKNIQLMIFMSICVFTVNAQMDTSVLNNILLFTEKSKTKIDSAIFNLVESLNAPEQPTQLTKKILDQFNSKGDITYGYDSGIIPNYFGRDSNNYLFRNRLTGNFTTSRKGLGVSASFQLIDLESRGAANNFFRIELTPIPSTSDVTIDKQINAPNLDPKSIHGLDSLELQLSAYEAILDQHINSLYRKIELRKKLYSDSVGFGFDDTLLAKMEQNISQLSKVKRSINQNQQRIQEIKNYKIPSVKKPSIDIPEPNQNIFSLKKLSLGRTHSQNIGPTSLSVPYMGLGVEYSLGDFSLSHKAGLTQEMNIFQSFQDSLLNPISASNFYSRLKPEGNRVLIQNKITYPANRSEVSAKVNYYGQTFGVPEQNSFMDYSISLKRQFGKKKGLTIEYSYGLYDRLNEPTEHKKIVNSGYQKIGILQKINKSSTTIVSESSLVGASSNFDGFGIMGGGYLLNSNKLVQNLPYSITLTPFIDFYTTTIIRGDTLGLSIENRGVNVTFASIKNLVLGTGLTQNLFLERYASGSKRSSISHNEFLVFNYKILGKENIVSATLAKNKLFTFDNDIEIEQAKFENSTKLNDKLLCSIGFDHLKRTISQPKSNISFHNFYLEGKVNLNTTTVKATLKYSEDLTHSISDYGYMFSIESTIKWGLKLSLLFEKHTLSSYLNLIQPKRFNRVNHTLSFSLTKSLKQK